MMNKIRIFYSLLWSSLSTAIICLIASMIESAGDRVWAILFLPAIVLVVFLHAILLGLPCFLLLARCSLIRWWTLTLAGFLAGSVPGSLVILIRQTEISSSEIPSVVTGVLAMGLIGALNGALFWVVWRHLGRNANPELKL